MWLISFSARFYGKKLPWWLKKMFLNPLKIKQKSHFNPFWMTVTSNCVSKLYLFFYTFKFERAALTKKNVK